MAQNTDALLTIAGFAYHGAGSQNGARGHRGFPLYLSMDSAVESRLAASRGERCLLYPRRGEINGYDTDAGVFAARDG